MASKDGNSKEYAPGVSCGGENSNIGGALYSGKSAALIDSGLVRAEWMPGAPGNGKTMQSVVFLADGTAKVLPARSQFKSFDVGFGGIRICKSGGIYHVWRYWTQEERLKKAADEQETKERETWLAAKEASSQSDFPRRWKDGVLHHINQAERLIAGKLVFTDFPDVGITESDAETAKRIIADLKNLLSWVTPMIKNKVTARSNVFSLNDAAFRNMRKH